MAEFIIMPKQGLQMTEGTIMEWLVDEGQEVVADEPLFEMETDKLTITIDASQSGTLLKILHDVGDEVPITQPIAIIGEKGEDYSSLLSAAGTAVADVTASMESQEAENAEESIAKTTEKPLSGKVFISPRAKMMAGEKGIDYLQIAGSGPEGLIIETDILEYEKNPVSKTAVSPLARKIAEQENVDLGSVQGSGVRQKVMADDVRAMTSGQQAQGVVIQQLDEERIPISGMRKIVAERMKVSLTEMAQANHRMTVDMTNSVA